MKAGLSHRAGILCAAETESDFFRSTVMKKLCLKLIRFYQKKISPRTPPAGRLEPTCSQYTYEAIERFGVVYGILLGIGRILRCNPLFPGGYDPVPEKRVREKKKKNQKTDPDITK